MKNLRALTRASLLTGFCLLVSLAANANCDFPASLEVPDGNTASEAELVASQAAIKQYMASAEEYVACLDAEAEAIGPEITEDQVRIRDMKHDAAVDEMEKLAAEFNAQVRAFKRNNK
ncbi:MAG: hypothetical protein P8R04_03665 [Gammaproteobacteria bacterium]|nr:hypothetical protein [Gammaproteobacteria bacterium]